jgi:hypothetical protein
MKTCCICKIEKDESCFGKYRCAKDGLRYQCKQCRKKYYDKHKEDIAKQNKIYYCTNKEYILERQKEQYHKNPALFLERQKIYHSDPETKIKRNNRVRDRYWNDIQYRIEVALRTRLRRSIQHGWKNGSAIRDLGCSIPEAKIWLENQFSTGMTWDNWGSGENDWQIDHIFPFHLCDLTKREDVIKVCHYTNLRPLWKKDNMSRTYEEFD